LEKNCKIQNNVSVYKGVTNIYNPRAKIPEDDPCAADAGETGAVGNRNAPDYGLVAGNPGKRLGWVCRCGGWRRSGEMFFAKS